MPWCQPDTLHIKREVIIAQPQLSELFDYPYTLCWSQLHTVYVQHRCPKDFSQGPYIYTKRISGPQHINFPELKVRIRTVVRQLGITDIQSVP